MSYTFALDSLTTNDMRIVGGKLLRVSGSQEVSQRVLVSLLHFYGEYFLNVPGGVPWYELILGGKDVKLAEMLLRQAVLNVPGVNGIVSFTTSYVKRNLSVTMLLEVQGSGTPVPVLLSYDQLSNIIDGGLFNQPVPPSTADGGSF
jgi:hypothetical protein